MVYGFALFVNGAVLGGALVRREWGYAAAWALSAFFFSGSLWFSASVVMHRAVVAFIESMEQDRTLRSLRREGRP